MTTETASLVRTVLIITAFFLFAQFAGWFGPRVDIDKVRSDAVHDCALKGYADWATDHSDPATFVVCYVD